MDQLDNCCLANQGFAWNLDFNFTPNPGTWFGKTFLLWNYSWDCKTDLV